ncbi:hypothetical protein Tsubulata_027945 [Turnera subulata]|uniref:Rab proteins geranylgeranyltransferase component n=1 Tax=Turnera subulata TaxID=218843 RepID=A0A9Q0G6L4_9ROSI|nr:hypothetical protein Tsubulata_027945 [Turnera subulata]
MSDGLPPYPPIDPTTFDLIVIGTGLPESLIAAAASAAGKTVVHLDPNPFYGSHFSSLSLPELTSFLNTHSTPPPNPAPPFPSLAARPLYSDVEISDFAPELLRSHSREFNLDLSGPRALFCADKSIDLLLKSGASQYLEFKSVEASFVGDGDGNLWSVPDSRAAIFKDKSLSLREKNQLMRFFKLVQRHLSYKEKKDNGGGGEEEEEEEEEDENARVSEEDLEMPFFEFLTKMRLPDKIKSIILYAIAMADYDQENTEVCKDLLRTREGIDRLALYQSSMGRFKNAAGALIYPIYGQGELPQAFCRRAAVKGCIYVLRMPVISLLTDESNGSYKGVRLASGQDIFSPKLVVDPSFVVLSVETSPLDPMHEQFRCLTVRDVKGKVARGICITRRSLKPDVSNVLVIYPPRSLYPEQMTSVRALQISSKLAVCPEGMFVLYLSTVCDNIDQGKRSLKAAINALVTLPDSESPENSSKIQSGIGEEAEPTLLWSGLYIQELTMASLSS